MSKAILVLDMPVHVCQKCDLCYPCGCNQFLCAAMDKEIPDGEIPDWCPLKPLPQKKEIEGLNITTWVKSLGYNECIDDILKESED